MDVCTVWATSMESAYATQLAFVWRSLAAEQWSAQLAAMPLDRKQQRKLLHEPDFSDHMVLSGSAAKPFKHGKIPCKISRRRAVIPKGDPTYPVDPVHTGGSAIRAREP